MTPFYTDDWLTLYGRDCLDVLREMPADSVDCVVRRPKKCKRCPLVYTPGYYREHVRDYHNES